MIRYSQTEIRNLIDLILHVEPRNADSPSECNRVNLLPSSGPVLPIHLVGSHWWKFVGSIPLPTFTLHRATKNITIK
jgi:hypothetical protein